MTTRTVTYDLWGASGRRSQIAHPVADHTRLPGWGSVAAVKGTSAM